DQPAGTRVVLSYRGATNVTTGATIDNVLTNAARLDPYGDPLDGLSGAPSFPANNPQGLWRDSVSVLDGNRFYQVRMTFVSNAETLERAALSGFGIAYGQ